MVSNPFRRKPESQDGSPQSRKPADSKFKQQKLPAWQPILTASTVLPIFFLIGLIFLPLGIGLLVSSNNVKELIIEYTNCANGTTSVGCESNLEANFKKGVQSHCSCSKQFTLDEAWDTDVYFYYGLSNYYQNHRRYVRSRDDNQLYGDVSGNPSSMCEPYDKTTVVVGNVSVTQYFAPCGAVANSMFNDVFKLFYTKKGDVEVPWTYKNIAWKSDREAKFKNPKAPLNVSFAGKVKPKYWTKNVWELDPLDDNNNGFLNQDFIVWMRVAAFPTFRKLYRILVKDGTKGFANGLPAGTYRLDVEYNYPVSSFDGKKRFILSTSSWIGGKNPFLGIAYIVVGSVCLVFGFIFLVIHMKVRTRPLSH